MVVNWREDIEFFYGLATVLSVVLTFFMLYTWTGMIFAAGVSTAVGVVMALVGFAVFESEQAIERWKKLTKQL
jgi:hypothetical protein